MKVVELMRTHIVKISPESAIADAVDMMDLYQLTSIAVVDSQGNPIGLIEDRVIAEAVIGSKNLDLTYGDNRQENNRDAGSVRSRAISTLMRSPAPTIDENAEVEEAARLMISNNLMHIPVTTQGKVTGRLSQIDICQAVLEGQISW